MLKGYGRDTIGIQQERKDSMRTETEMMDLIMTMAMEDERIRAVELNGSRVNPEVEPDCFQDFDVIFYTNDLQHFINDRSWMERFGEMMILQMPKINDHPEGPYEENFNYLMQFKDGNRIDLIFLDVNNMDEWDFESLRKILLDKDGLYEENLPSDLTAFYPIPPTQLRFDCCTNEFWWVSNYVAKALWRNQIYLGKHILEHYVRAQVEKLLDWHFGNLTDYNRNPGKCGSYYHKVLDGELLSKYNRTFPRLNEQEMWEALFVMTEIVSELAPQIAAANDLVYNMEEETNVMIHLRHVRELPKDATSIY